MINDDNEALQQQSSFNHQQKATTATTASTATTTTSATTSTNTHTHWNKDSYYHPKLHYVTEGLKSNQSSKQYEYQFNAFLRYLGLNSNPDDKEAYDKGLVLLLSKEPEEIEELISEFLIYLKDKKHLKTSSINLSKSAIVHFFKRNRIRLNKDWISGFIPGEEGYKQDRPYTHEEIQKMLDACSEDRVRVAILLMTSTGMRIGALTCKYYEADNEMDVASSSSSSSSSSVLEFGDLTWLPEYGIYRIMVYNRSKDGRYATYCSQECARILNRYLDYRRKECGEVMTETTPIIREQFDPNDKLAISSPRKIMDTTLTKVLRTVRKKAGLDESVNHHVKLTHGYRKFAITMMNKSGILDTHRRYLTGHAQVGQDASYVLPTHDDLLSAYLLAEPLLTIDPKKRLEQENADLRKTQSDYLAELGDLRQEFNEMKIYLTNLGMDRRKRLVNEFCQKSSEELQDQCFESEA